MQFEMPGKIAYNLTYWTEPTVNQRPLQAIIQPPASQNIPALHTVQPIYYSDIVIKLPISHQKGVIIFLK